MWAHSAPQITQLICSLLWFHVKQMNYCIYLILFLPSSFQTLKRHWQAFSNLFLKFIALRYNSHTVQVTLLKYTIWWFWVVTKLYHTYLIFTSTHRNSPYNLQSSCTNLSNKRNILPRLVFSEINISVGRLMGEDLRKQRKIRILEVYEKNCVFWSNYRWLKGPLARVPWSQDFTVSH